MGLLQRSQRPRRQEDERGRIPLTFGVVSSDFTRPGSGGNVVVNHVHVRRHSEAIAYALQLTFGMTLVLGLLSMVITCVLFAALFFACGSACFIVSRQDADEDRPFAFDDVIWLSVHTFTTIGYGSIYPTCVAGQVLVLLEHYVSVVISGLITAALIFKFLRPTPHIRFSDNFLIDSSADIDGDGVPDGTYLTFRVVKESPQTLSDCDMAVHAMIKHQVGTGGSEIKLPLRSSKAPDLQAWVIWHKIDDHSPLNNMSRFIGLTARLTVFDAIYGETVRVTKHYTKADMVMHACFEDMLFQGKPTASGRPLLTIDHSKVSCYEKLVDGKKARSAGVPSRAPMARHATSGMLMSSSVRRRSSSENDPSDLNGNQLQSGDFYSSADESEDAAAAQCSRSCSHADVDAGVDESVRHSGCNGVPIPAASATA